MRKGSKFTAEQLERIHEAAKKRSRDPKWRAAAEAAGKKRSEDPKWRAATEAAAKKRSEDPKWRAAIRAAYARPEVIESRAVAAKRRSEDPKWLEAIQKAAARPEVIESKIVYGPREPWNRDTITVDDKLLRYDEGLCRYCNRPRQPDRKDCHQCMVKHVERNREYRARKKQANNSANKHTGKPAS
ncbi:MAG: hypothetical protein WBL50_27900 [Candidatus Acidiferrum sp.]